MMMMTLGVEAAWAGTKNIVAEQTARERARSRFIFISRGSKLLILKGYENKGTGGSERLAKLCVDYSSWQSSIDLIAVKFMDSLGADNALAGGNELGHP